MNRLARFFVLSVLLILAGLQSSQAQPDEQYFSQAELDQMLAPIALYPDALLSQILTAATYPLEIVEARRWTRNHPGLEGEEAVAAVADQDWDPSVQALVAFPQVLERMDENLDWTQNLGDAVLFQETQVMDTIQGLRQRAYEAGNLESTGNVRVIREQEVIIIEPVQPQIVYVPYYDPYVIYGRWWWPAYHPYYWGPPGFHLGVGFFWGSGIYLSTGFFFSNFDWHRRHIVHVHHHHHHSRPHFVGGKHTRFATSPKWRHNPTHRRGVAYRNRALPTRHAHSSTRNVAQTRQGYRHQQRQYGDRQRTNYSGRSVDSSTGNRGSRSFTDRSPGRTAADSPRNQDNRAARTRIDGSGQQADRSGTSRSRGDATTSRNIGRTATTPGAAPRAGSDNAGQRSQNISQALQHSTQQNARQNRGAAGNQAGTPSRQITGNRGGRESAAAGGGSRPSAATRGNVTPRGNTAAPGRATTPRSNPPRAGARGNNSAAMQPRSGGGSSAAQPRARAGGNSGMQSRSRGGGGGGSAMQSRSPGGGGAQTRSSGGGNWSRR